MSILVSALEYICENATFTKLYNEIVNNVRNSDVGNERDGSVTDSWVSGIMASRGSSEGKLAQALAKLDAGQLDPESKEYRDAKRIKIAFETLTKYGMVKRGENGRFTFPSSAPADSGKRQMLSQFRNFLSGALNQDKVDNDITKTMRNGVDEASQQWAASLPPEKKKMLDAYKEMGKSTFTFLKSLLAVRTQVGELRKRLNGAKYNESNDYLTLKNLGFLSDDDKLNLPLVKQFNEFLRDPDGNGGANSYARLKPFEREKDFHVTRSTADKALARNALDKRLDSYSDTSGDSDRYVQGIMGDLTPQEIQHMIALHKGQQIEPNALNNLKATGLVDADNNFTDVGKAVAASLNVDPDVDNFSAEAIKRSRLSGIKGDRRAERTVDRKTNFKKYAGLDV